MEEYIKKLAEKLANYSEETRNEILEDYKEHFYEGHAEGRTDEEIIADLGDIDEMLTGISEAPSKKPITVSNPTVCPSGVDNINSIFVDTTLDNHYVGYSAHVFVYPSDDGKIYAEYKASESESAPKVTMITTTENGVFKITLAELEAPESPSGFFSKLFRSARLAFSDRDYGTIIVKVPLNFPTVTVKNSSGKSELQNLCVGTLITNSSSGAVKCSEIKANNMSVVTSSGSSQVSSISASHLEIRSSSGSSSVGNCLAEVMNVTSSSGSCNVSDVKASTFAMKASSGSAHANRILGNKISVVTSSGSSHINCSARDISVTSGSGYTDINIEGSFDVVTVKSGSGAVKLSGHDVIRSTHNIHHGNGGVTIHDNGITEKLPSVVNVTCGSGHITISE